MNVIVVGGGVAGIVAALDCAAAGASVTLVEVRPRLGGAAYSVQRGELWIDNGQHVFLRCCTAYRGLLERLGSDSLVEVQPFQSWPDKMDPSAWAEIDAAIENGDHYEMLLPSDFAKPTGLLTELAVKE